MRFHASLLARLRVSAPDVAVTVLFETGHTVPAIVDGAAAVGADLIVMGSHGTNGFERGARTEPMGPADFRLHHEPGHPTRHLPGAVGEALTGGDACAG